MRNSVTFHEQKSTLSLAGQGGALPDIAEFLGIKEVNKIF